MVKFKMTEEAILLARFIGYPFLIGVIWNFIGAWAGIPALFVFGIYWLGTLTQIYQLQIQSKKP